MIEDGAAYRFSVASDRSEYLGSERIVYGVMEGFESKQPIRASCRRPTSAESSIRPGSGTSSREENSAHCTISDTSGNRSTRH